MAERTCCDGQCWQGRDCPLQPRDGLRSLCARCPSTGADSHLSINAQGAQEGAQAWRLDPHQQGHMRRLQAEYARQDALDRLVERAVLGALAGLCAWLVWGGLWGGL